MEISRRVMLGGMAATVGAVIAADRLRFFMPSAQAQSMPGQTTGQATTYRTGHSNNCDGVCGHLVKVVDGRATMVSPAPWETTTVSGDPVPAFSPRICARGISQVSNTYSPDRIKYPYKRVGERGSGQWERISWDEATTMIAEAFQKAQQQYGKKSVWVAPYTGSLSLIEGVVGAGFRFCNVTGASAGDSMGDNEGDSATPAGWNYVLCSDPDQNDGGGFDGHEASDLLSSEAIVFWANNAAETAIPDWRIYQDARQASGTQLIAVDPRFTPTAAGCDQWLPIRPGSDTALIDGLINYVMSNGLYDAEYISKYTVGPYLIDPKTNLWLRSKDVIPGNSDNDYVVFDQDDNKLKAAGDKSLKTAALLGKFGPSQAPTALQALADMASKYTLDYTSQLTDVPSAQIEKLAQTWATSKPVGVRAGFGLSHWYHGDLHMQALLTLQAITGNIGVHGGGVTTFGGGLTTAAFDFDRWWNPTRREDAPYDVLEPIDFCSAVTNSDPYKVSAAWFVIDNFAQQMSDRNKVVDAMKQLDFCVVSDYVLSATCDLADVVLPACTYLEKTDLLSSANFYLQYMPKIIDPLFESKSDLDAFTMVAQKMGLGQYFDQTPDVYLGQMMHIGEDDADDTVAGLTWDQLKSGAVHLNTDPIPYVPFFDKQFPTPSGKIEFYVEMLVPFGQQLAEHMEPVEASPSNPLYDKYPLVFLSTHTRFRTHSQYVNLPWLKEVNNGGMGFLEINPQDAAARGLKDGDVVRVFNDRGEMKVKARLTQAIKPGVVNCYQGGWITLNVQHYIEGHPNNLTHQIKNPTQAVIPNFPSNAAYFDCLVQVEAA